MERREDRVTARSWARSSLYTCPYSVKTSSKMDEVFTGHGPNARRAGRALGHRHLAHLMRPPESAHYAAHAPAREVVLVQIPVLNASS